MIQFDQLDDWTPKDDQMRQSELTGGSVDFSDGKSIDFGSLDDFGGQPYNEPSKEKQKMDVSLEALLPKDTLDVLHKHPNLYGTLGALYETGMSIGNFALDVIPGAKYLRPQDREEYMNLDLQHQVRAGLYEALGLSLFTPGGTAAAKLAFKGVKKAITFPFKTAGKAIGALKPRPKVRPVEDLVSWTTTSYEETLGKYLGRKGFSKIESKAIYEHLHGDTEALKRSMIESRLTGKKETSAFANAITRKEPGRGLKYLSEQKGESFGLSDELLAKIDPEKVRLDQLHKDFIKTVTRPEILGKTAYGKNFQQNMNVAYKAQAKRFYGAEAAEKMTIENASEHDLINFAEDMIGNPGSVKRAMRTPVMSALTPIRVVFGKGEELGHGTRNNIYLKLTAAESRKKEFVVSMTNVFQSIMEQRGLGKLVVKDGKTIFKDTTGITQTVRDKAGKILHETQKIMGNAEKINTPEAYNNAKNIIANLINKKDPDSKMVSAVIDTTYDFFDTLYAIDVHNTIAKEFSKVGFTTNGRAAFEKLLLNEAPKIQRLFSTGAQYNYVQKHKALTEILNRFKGSIPQTYKGKNVWFKSSGKKLEDSLNELNKQLTFQSKGGNFIDYRSNYTPRISAIGRTVEQKTFNMLGGKMSPFYTKQVSAAEPVESIGLEQLIVSRINAQGKRMYLYDTLEEVANYAKNLPQDWRNYTEHVTARLLGVPSRADAWLGKALDSVWIGKQGWDAQRVMNMTKNLNDLAYMGFLGLRPFSAMRNMFQPFLLLPADLGGIKDYGTMVSGFAKAFGPGGKAIRQEIKNMGIITEYAPETLRSRQLFGGTGRQIIGTKGLTQKGYLEMPSMESVRDTMSYMFSSADKYNRYLSAASAMVKWDRAVARFGGEQALRKASPEILNRFSKASGIQGRHPWIRREIEDKLSFGFLSDARKQYVTEVVSDTQYLYNILESPIIGQSAGGVGRTGSLFQSWWMNYGTLLHKWMTTGQSPTNFMGKNGAKVEKMFTFVLSSYAGYEIMKQMWGESTAARSTFLGPFPDPSMGMQLPPAWQVPAKAIGMTLAAAKTIQEGDIGPLNKQGIALLDSVTNFIPGAVLGKSILKGIQKQREGEKGALIRAPFKFKAYSKY